MATFTIEGSLTPGSEIGSKRFYLPGIVIKTKCPKCGGPYEKDMGDDYLSYPRIGVEDTINGYCESCSHSWEICGFTLKLILETKEL